MNGNFKNYLSYGTVMIAPMILMSLIIWIFNLGQNKSIGWISILVFIITIFFVQKHFRDNVYDGFISYGKLYGKTLLMLLFGAVIMGIYTYVFYKWIAPEELTKMLDMVKIQLYEQELPESQLKQAYEYNEKYIMIPGSMAFFSVITTVFQGVIIALITGIFVKKKADSYTEFMKELKTEEE